MSPLGRRRRRSLRTVAPALCVALAVAVVGLLLVGGVLRIGRSSGSYWRDVDRSYAAQMRAIVAQSDQAGSELTRLLPAMGGKSRPALQAALDTLVRTADLAAKAAESAAAPPPDDRVGTEVAVAFSERAQAVSGLRSVVDRLLAMAPLPVVGAPGSPVASSPSRPELLSTSSAASRLTQVGAQIELADRTYAGARQALRKAPGHASLPASVWVRQPGAWAASDAGSLVAELEGSPTLAPVQRVTLLTHTVTVTPPPVPPSASGPAGTSVVPPTHRLSLGVVVADQGNVADRRVRLRADVQPSGAEAGSASGAGAGSGAIRSTAVNLAPGGSVAASLGGFPVVPGRTYTVSLAMAPPSDNTPGAVTTDSFLVAIAPPAPATVGALTPPTGRPSGGTEVVITGTGFTTVTAVDFGKAPARFRVRSTTVITAVAPPGSGKVPVTVVNPGGTSGTTKYDLFTYKVPHHHHS